jgi:uncharacterized membrane protein YozB (DUF420 family)
MICERCFLLAIGLGNPRFLQTDLNLVLQITILAIIFVSLFYKRKNNFKVHGATMGLAVILQILAFILVMGPTFFNNFDFFYTSTSIPAVQTAWIHAVPGAIALLLGIYLVSRWAIKTSNVTGCYKRKRIMDATIGLWLFSLLFGIATYVLFYL